MTIRSPSRSSNSHVGHYSRSVFHQGLCSHKGDTINAQKNARARALNDKILTKTREVQARSTNVKIGDVAIQTPVYKDRTSEAVPPETIITTIALQKLAVSLAARYAGRVPN